MKPTQNNDLAAVLKRVTVPGKPPERPPVKQSFPHSHHRISMKGRGAIVAQERD